MARKTAASAHVECANSYRYAHVTAHRLLSDLDFGADAARPGDESPLFDLPTAEAGRVRSSEIFGARPVLLYTGSLSCPMTPSANAKLKRLHARFGADVDFLMLYVREAHPGEDIPQPETLARKIAHARSLQARDRLPWPIAVDGVDGRVHRALDVRPNVAYLFGRNGRIAFRALCAGDRAALAKAMAAVARGKALRESTSRRRLVPLSEGIGNLRWIARAAGRRAVRDVWRAVPPVAAVAWLADLYRPLEAKWRTAAAAATVAALVVAGARALRIR